MENTVTLLCAGFCFLLPFRCVAGIIGVNVDAIQPFSPSANNFEITIRVPSTETIIPATIEGVNYIGPGSVTENRLPDDSAHNTYQVVFSGFDPILPDSTTVYHFGFQLDTTTFMGMGVQEITAGGQDTVWTDNSVALPLLPTPTTAVDAMAMTAMGPTTFVTMFATAKFGGPSSGNQYQNVTHLWTEYEVPANEPLTLKYMNDSSDTLDLEQTGYLLTNTEIPLSELNLTDLPPDAFLPTLVPDGFELAPGGEIVAVTTPEPSTFVLVTLAAAVWCRRRAKALRLFVH
jgi:hypothetical protein